MDNVLTQTFDTLSTHQLYDILKLRAEVFVVEQQSIYLDVDSMDRDAIHISLYDQHRLVGYARILPPGTRFKEASVGKIVLQKDTRGKGNGRKLVTLAITESQQRFHTPIRIEGQTYLQTFYESFGFNTVGKPYIWDGVEHIEMLLAA